MTRVLFAIIALGGQIVWLITPKLASASNPFSVLAWYCIISAPIFLILSKVIYGSFITTSDWKMGSLYLLGGGIGTIAYILANKFGGNVSTIISITQLAIIGATLISFFAFHEKINTTQLAGIVLLCVGSILVLGFANK